MGGWLRAALRLAGILTAGLAAAVVAAHLLVDWLVSPQRVERWAQTELDRPVTIEDVELRLLPDPRVHLEGVSLESGVTGDVLELGLDEGALLERRFALESLHLKGARIAVVRMEDGRIVLGEDPGADDEQGGGTPVGLPPVARIEWRDSEVTWSDRAHPDLEPLSLRVDRLDIDGLRAGEVATFSLKARLGPETARLSAEGHYGPVEPEQPWDAPVSLDLELEGFDVRTLHGRLPPAWRIDAAGGSLAGQLHAEGSRLGDAEARVELSLDDAALELGRFGLQGRTQLEAQLARTDGAPALPKGRLRCARLLVANAAAGDVDLGFRWQPGRLEIDSIGFEAAGGHPLWSAGFGTPGVPLHVDARLDPGGQVRVHDVVVVVDDAGRRDVALPRIELRGVVVEAGSTGGTAPPLRVRLDELDLRDLTTGRTARYHGHGETGKSGTVELSGELGPIEYESDFGGVPINAKLRATGVDAAALAPLLPPKWGIGSAGGRAEVDLALRRGEDGHAHVQLQGGLDLSQLELFRWQASDVKGPIRYGDRTLSLDGVQLAAYGGAWTAQGSVRFEGPPRFDGNVAVRNLDVVRAAQRTDTSSSDDPILLDADGVLQGRWTGDPNWAAHLEGSQVRVDAHGGRVSHVNLLRSIGHALRGFVPELREREPDPDEKPVPRSRIAHIRATLTPRDGALYAPDLRMRTDDYRVEGRGTLRHDWTTDIQGSVVLTRQGRDKTLTLAQLPVLGEATRLPAIPVQARGPIGDLQVGADAASLPEATVRGILGVPIRTLDSLIPRFGRGDKPAAE